MGAYGRCSTRLDPLTSSRQWCLSRAISTCDHKTGNQVQAAPRRVGKASPSVSILSARPLAVTADVDRVMSELSMMTTLAKSCEQRLLHPEESAWCPLAAPADQVVLVHPMYLNDVQYEDYMSFTSVWDVACNDIFHLRAVGDPWVAPE